METCYLFNELLLDVILLIGLEEGKQTLLFIHWAATQHNGQTLQQSGHAVERLVLLVL